MKEVKIPRSEYIAIRNKLSKIDDMELNIEFISGQVADIHKKVSSKCDIGDPILPLHYTLFEQEGNVAVPAVRSEFRSPPVKDTVDDKFKHLKSMVDDVAKPVTVVDDKFKHLKSMVDDVAKPVTVVDDKFKHLKSMVDDVAKPVTVVDDDILCPIDNSVDNGALKDNKSCTTSSYIIVWIKRYLVYVCMILVFIVINKWNMHLSTLTRRCMEMEVVCDILFSIVAKT
jgi:hypothetical protein